jgi:hypothetical protein
MKNMLTLLFASTLFLNGQAQDKFFTRDGFVSFYSATPMENISAENKKATCIYSIPDGRFEFAVLMKAFHFEKALMEEHFNENYAESEKFPKSVFKGTIVSPSGLRPGALADVKVKGSLTLHGVTREIETTGTIEKTGDNIKLKSEFLINPEDYNIGIPKTVRDNIAKEIKVNVDMNLAPFTR